MESVKLIVNKFALLVSVIAFISALIGGISLGTALIRSSLVYLFTLVVIIIALRILKWNFLNSPSKAVVNDEKNSEG